MSALFESLPVPVEAQIAELERELAQRGRVYPRRIDAGKMSQSQADRQTAALAAALRTLKGLLEAKAAPPEDLPERVRRAAEKIALADSTFDALASLRPEIATGGLATRLKGQLREASELLKIE